MRISAAVIAACMVVVACGEPTTAPGVDSGSDVGCARDAECSDGLFCNGEELCAPDDPAADARGCVTAASTPCAGACDESANRCETASCETPDADGDGYDSLACDGEDCDDTDPDVHPAAVEVCDADGVDEDCDATTYGPRDRDGDGADDGACCNGAVCGEDCDDTRPGVSPIAPEVCDTFDNDCDEAIDEGVLVTCYVDADRDRYAPMGARTTRACDCPVGTTTMPPEGSDVDCDDAPSTGSGRSPAVPEVCNTIDDDCDGDTDELLTVPCWADADGDGYALASAAPMDLCSCPDGTTVRSPASAADCDDASAAVSPAGGEGCTANGIDDDCDGTIDDVAGDDWYRDCDLDGYGSAADTSPIRSCVMPGSVPACGGGGGWARNDHSDCVDTSAAIRPGTRPGDTIPAELCDGADNDCNPTTADGRDESWVAMPCDGADGDLCREGLLTCGAGGVDMVCTDPSGETDIEACGGGDEDCDGTIDEAAAANAECDARMLPHVASATCTAGTCSPAVCAAAYNDCTTAAGCETMCQWPGCSGAGCADPIAIGAFSSFGTPQAQTSCAVRRGGELVCWGLDSATVHATPVRVPDIPDAVQVDGACVLRASGTVARLTSTFVGGWTPVAGVSGATQVACDNTGGCAITGSGTVVCWGGAGWGLVGNGSRTDAVGTVTGLTDAVEIHAGHDHRCARRATGQVVCWGFDHQGQLGDGASAAGHTTCDDAGVPVDCTLAPVAVAGLSDAVEIATSINASCARRSTGDVVCWGEGRSLGDGLSSHGTTCPGRGGPLDCAASPVPVPGASPASLIVSSPASDRVCVVRSGALLCWRFLSTPYADTTGFSGITELAISMDGRSGTLLHWTCAIDAAGLRCAGTNGSGQLGDGTTTARTSPVLVLAPP